MKYANNVINIKSTETYQREALNFQDFLLYCDYILILKTFQNGSEFPRQSPFLYKYKIIKWVQW